MQFALETRGRPGACRRLPTWTLACALAATAGPILAAPPTLSDCSTPEFATTLHATPGSDPAPEARAYWLDRQSIQWPGAPADAHTFRLFHSSKARIGRSNGRLIGSPDGSLRLLPDATKAPAHLATRFKFIGDGPRLRVSEADLPRLATLLRGQLLLVAEDARGREIQSTALQLPGALDDLYADAGLANDLGVTVSPEQTGFALWAPTAQNVALCRYGPGANEVAVESMQLDAGTGIWRNSLARDLTGQYYQYLVDVVVPGVGLVRNRVTDPYSVSLDADSKRSYIANLDSPSLKPDGWDKTPAPHPGLAQTDMVIYELHVRDFSINDPSVAKAMRGKYGAFALADSQGRKHLQALAKAGMTDVHLLPVFDLASVPEVGCKTPKISNDGPASESQQAAVMAVAATDCFNWGYDPLHFNAPEGSFASNASDGALRIREFRQMVQALHHDGLRVGMDVVYNHTSASGQNDKSVLDRVVPGYYHRLDAKGSVERSTCCENTATEHRMMAKLMSDSALLWATQYRIDSFRFDLMAHQPRSEMEALSARVDKATGRHVNLIGEGWNFGEVANGARFVQASQLSLGGSGIGSFSDRGRDAVRGGGAADSGEAMMARQGYINGLVYAPNAKAPSRPMSDLLKAADMVRVGLAGSIRDYTMTDHTGRSVALSDIDYGGQPAGYVGDPAEVVNYVENHDNQTLFDANVYKLPAGTSSTDRARVQMLAAAINAFSQGVAYFHAGIDTLRSKSLDRNSYDSGDWFNRIDWSGQDNYFGTGLPPKPDNGRDYDLMRALLANAAIRPSPTDIGFARDAFRDLLRIRASSRLFRLRSAAEIKARLGFPNTGPAQNPVVQVGHLDGRGLDGANFSELLYFINVDDTAQVVSLPAQASKPWTLHPVHLDTSAADPRPRQDAIHDRATGRFTVPPRTALVYVVN